jgi:diaminopimelate decarboxylase
LSIKTDPWDDLGTTAVRLGWWAEAISVQEVDWALSCGFRRDQIVFNGPAANALRASDKGPLASAFADSTEALDDVLCDGVCDVAGARLRLPSTISRFGIDVSEPNVFAAATRKLAARPNRAYGVHFHVAADACGPSRWFELIEEAIVWVRAFTISVGRAPKLLDVGGGWHHEDFHEILLPSLRYLQDHVRSALPSVEAIILEPGKAVSTMTASMLCEITEVRTTSTPRGLQVVIDAAVADLPMAPLYAYAVTLYREGTAIGCLTGGTARVLGRSCMEADLLADRVSFPVPPRVGDRLLFSGAGGYNASMAYHFGRGSNGETRLQ